MDNDTFKREKRAAMRRHQPAGSSQLSGLALDLSFYLDQSPLVTAVKVTKTGDPNALLRIRCRPTAPTIPAAALHDALVWAWREQLLPLHPYTTTISTHDVTLEFLVLEGESQCYVTGKITVVLQPRSTGDKSP